MPRISPIVGLACIFRGVLCHRRATYLRFAACTAESDLRRGSYVVKRRHVAFGLQQIVVSALLPFCGQKYVRSQAYFYLTDGFKLRAKLFVFVYCVLVLHVRRASSTEFSNTALGFSSTKIDVWP